MRRQIAALVVGMLTFPQLVSGQTLTPGSRVRITHPGEGTRTGTVVALTADTLEVRLAGRIEPAHLPLAELTRLDVSRGRERHMGNAGKGLVIGAVAGVVAGLAAGDDDCSNKLVCISRPAGAVLGGAFFGGIGGVLGLVSGVIPSESWERVPLQERRVSLVVPAHGRGAGLGLRLAF